MATLSLHHFNGTDGDTTTTDSSGTPGYSLTFSGATTPELDDGFIKFGSTSLQLASGGNNRVSYNSFSVPSGDWTWEFFVRPVGGTSSGYVMSYRDGVGGQGLTVFYDGTNVRFTFGLSSNGTSNDILSHSATPGSHPANTWYHIAIVRDGTTWSIYVEGTRLATTTSALNVGPGNSPKFAFGDSLSTTTQACNIDEARLSDTAIYSGASYTVPTSEFAIGPPADLGAWLPMDEGTGTTLTDVGGAGNNASFAGGAAAPTWTTDSGETVVYFDGGDKATITDAYDINLNDDVTFECKFKLNALATGIQPLFVKSDGASPNRTLEVWVDADTGNFEFYADDGTGAQSWNYTGGGIAVDTWYELAIVLDRAAGTVVAYLDGSSVTLSSSTIRTEDGVDSSADADIGYDDDGAVGFYGVMTFMALWNTTRTLSEVNGDFDSGSASIEGTPTLPMKTLTSPAAPSSSVTLPMKTLTAPPGIYGEMTLPLKTAYGETAGLVKDLPMKTLLAGTTDLIKSLPMKTISAETSQGTYLNSTLPLKTILALDSVPAGTDSDLAVALPARTLTATLTQDNLHTLSASLPKKTITAGGNHSAYLTLPLLTTSGSALTGTVSTSADTLPLLQLLASGVSSPVLTSSLSLPNKRISADGLVGKVTTAELTLPLRRLTAAGEVWNQATATITLPIIDLTALGGQNNTATTTVTLPAPYLEITAISPVTGQKRTWVLNTERLALSEFTNWDFNSYTTHGGLNYGANENGIYLLDNSATDAGTAIEGVFRTGVDSLGNSYVKRVPRIYVSMRADGNILFRTITQNSGPRTYRLTYNNFDGHQQRRVPVGKGPRAAHWQFEILNEDGADFEVDSLMVYPTITRKRTV